MFTQIVHPLCLKPFKPQIILQDIQKIDESKFGEDIFNTTGNNGIATI